MAKEVEVMELDLRYERSRMQSASRERQVLVSIMEVGIIDPLWGVLLGSGQKILLDGFKRVRCARKIGLQLVPFESIGDDEATAILSLLKAANRSSISFLEQAMFVDELSRTHGLSVAEIASRLQKSKAWVSVRLRTFSEMSEATRASIMSGAFPLYAYLYTLHPFRRLNGVTAKLEVDEFVSLVSGKTLSAREIERLAQAFFRGGDEMRRQLKNGDLNWCLDELLRREELSKSADLSDAENKVVRDLEIVAGTMGRLGIKLPSSDTTKPAFRVRGDLLADKILSQLIPFTKAVRDFYDRCRKA